MRILIRDLSPGQDYLFQYRTNNGTTVSEWSIVNKFTTIGDVTPPAPVTNLQWNPTGESFVGSWDAPTTDSNSKPLKDLKDYEVTIRAISSNVTKKYYTVDRSFELTLVGNAQAFGGIELEVEISVRARDTSNNVSTPVVKIALEDTPPTPSKPNISLVSGLVAVEWDGGTSVGTINPFNLAYIEIHASTANNFTPADATLVSRFEGWVSGKQRNVITGLTYGSQYYFKLVSVNKKGKKSPASVQETGTPTRISGLDIQNGTITTNQINFVDQLGGGRAWYQTTAPTTGMSEGDVWFDTDDQNHVYVYDAGQWKDARDATIALAQTAANNALTSANGKNRIYAQDAQPTGGVYTNGDTWFDTDDGNKPYTYIGGTWTNMRDATIATAQTAANTALTAANGKNKIYYQTTQPSGGTYINGDMWFDTDDQNKPYVYFGGTWSNARDASIAVAAGAASTADSKAVAAQTAATNAATAASNAQVAADDAQDAADLAAANALAASGLAGSKGKVWYQTTAPPGNANDLWIDITGSANTPKRWNGTAWVAVTDKAATDAATAAATANTAAGTAQTTANTAVTNAQTAQSRADAAHTLATTANTTANGKNTVTYSTAVASGSGTRAGDIWFQRDGAGVIIAQWEWTGAAWAARTLGNAVIANLDAGKITTGSLDANRIAADTITSNHIAANAITTSELAAGSVTTAAMTANTINGDRIAAGTLNADRIVADSITAAQIAANAITTSELSANAVTAVKVAAGSITADRLTIGDTDNLAENPQFDYGTAGWAGSFVLDTTKKRSGTASMRIDSNGTIRDVTGTPVRANGEANEQFYAEMWVMSNNITATGTLQLGATATSQTGVLSYPQFASFTASQLSTTVWTKISGTISLPAGTASFVLRPSVRETVATGFSLWIDDVVLRRMTPSVLIADGAVTATKINAGAVTADKVGTNLIITAAANIGTAVIDSSKIASLDAGVIVANQTSTNQIIANTAQIKDAIITSAKIINITADKILTGSLQAGQKIIAGAASGDHAEMTSTGFRVFTNDPLDGIPNEVIRMGTDTNDFFGVVNSTGNLVASVDDTGSASFNRLVANSISLNGAELATLISDIPQGEVGRFRGTLGADLGRIYVDYGVAEVGAALVKGRAYRVDYRVTYKTEVGGDEVLVSLRHTQGTDGNVTTQAPTPSTNNTRFQVHRSTGERANYWYTVTGSAQFYPTATTRHRIHMDIGRGPAGASPSNLGAFYVTTDPIELMITDLGPAGPVSGGFTSAGGQLVGAGAATPAQASTSQQYFVDLAPAGWASLRGDGTTRTDTTGPVQGWDPGGFNGDGRGHWYFNLPSITGVINRMDFYCYSNHWYYNTGGTAIFNVAVGSTPYAKPRGDWFVGGYPKPGGKEVQLPVDWYPMFTNAGAYGYPRANGITVGWSGNTNLAYYGRFDGNSARLRIYYTQ